MRDDPFDPASAESSRDADAPLELTDGMPPPGWEGRAYRANLPVVYRGDPWRHVVLGASILFALLFALTLWLALTAPLSKSLQPPAPPSITLLSAEGQPIARRGAIIAERVDVANLPPHVAEAFLAIEDRRFYSHFGVDPRGILRAATHNLFSDGSLQGGSTITQQLAKNAFLDADRTFTRKIRELLISFWLEIWLSKDEILSRYLSNVYFGDNVYGLRAAANHYFSRDPEELTLGQAAMLAGLVKAPSRLAPTGNLKGARARQALVVGAMVDAGFIDQAEADTVKPAVLKVRRRKDLPNGTYFADWVLPEARDQAGEIANDRTVATTLEMQLQRTAERTVRRAGLGKLQIALVAMREDGRVVAMVGGRDYGKSAFNRATQAMRQPGSTFKLFVYLAALRSGMTPQSLVEDAPITIKGWSPENADGRYLGWISLEDAFARSSNVAAVRLTQRVGTQDVIRAARDLGITTPIPDAASIALGTSTGSLIELTAAYAAIAAGRKVTPHGLPDSALIEPEQSWMSPFSGRSDRLARYEVEGMRTLLAASARRGTGRAANLSIPTFGKTGTTQDNRDALFVGYAGGLITGIWVGNDDNSPSGGLAGGGLPARIWRDFMTGALGVDRAGARPQPVAEKTVEPDNGMTEFDNMMREVLPPDPVEIEGRIGGLGLNLRVGRNGELEIIGPEPRGGREFPPPREGPPLDPGPPPPPPPRGGDEADEF